MPGLYANIRAKQDRIKAGSKEKMRKPGSRPGTFADADQLARGSLSTAGEGISLFLDETEIARLKRLFGQR